MDRKLSERSAHGTTQVQSGSPEFSGPVGGDHGVSFGGGEAEARGVSEQEVGAPAKAGRKATAAGGVSCVAAHDANLLRLANAIAARVGPQRFHVWFDNSTRLDLRNDNLEISVPNDFIGEWIGQRFTGTIQEAAIEVFGGPLRLRFQVQPELFSGRTDTENFSGGHGAKGSRVSGVTPRKALEAADPLAGTDDERRGVAKPKGERAFPVVNRSVGGAKSAEQALSGAGGTGGGAAAGQVASSQMTPKQRLRHDLASYVVGASNQLAYNAAVHVAQFPGTQYNPLFIHGGCGLGKTHLIQGLCTRFIAEHPTRRWAYMTGEEFTNDYVQALRGGKVDAFRRRMRELDLLIIDDVHFLAGKKATQEEFLHTFNAIEALGKQVVMASDSHPKEIAEFGESLVNRFVSGMVVRVDPPNFGMRCEILKRLAVRQKLNLSEDVVAWVARRVTQNVRELEGAVTRIGAHAMLSEPRSDGLPGGISVELAQAALGELDRMMVAPVKPENVLTVVAAHFGIEAKDLMSGRRHRTVSLARSVAMYLVRKTAKLSYPEIGSRLGKRNHSTVISACRRIESAVNGNEVLEWSGALGERREEAAELVQRLEEHARACA